MIMTVVIICRILKKMKKKVMSSFLNVTSMFYTNIILLQDDNPPVDPTQSITNIERHADQSEEYGNSVLHCFNQCLLSLCSDRNDNPCTHGSPA